MKQQKKIEKQIKNPNQKIYDETNHTKATSSIEQYMFDKCKKIFDKFNEQLTEINKEKIIK